MLAEIEKVPLWKEDERGKAYQFSTRESSFYIALYRRKGTTSGDHYHKGTIKSKSPEIFYFIDGKAELHLKDQKSGLEERHIIEPGTKIQIPPNIYHSFRALTDIILIEFNVSKSDFENYEADTIKLNPHQ
ncbi:cupin domain-containing protein [Patescibacteria group bacterium]|nr:cupin domain-containing protein [Patescibacteria group bacterium]